MNCNWGMQGQPLVLQLLIDLQAGPTKQPECTPDTCPQKTIIQHKADENASRLVPRLICFLCIGPLHLAMKPKINRKFSDLFGLKIE